jgi:hypothetical protein
MASATKYVGLGGSGCTAVCAGTAFVAASIRLPYLSYECAGASLADTTAYPDLTRFGTVTTPVVDIIKQLGEEVADWSFVAIVSGDPAAYRDEAEQKVAALSERGLGGDYWYAYETKWDEIVTMVDELRMQKQRVIFLMGSESYVRKVICASMVVQANKGITWLSEGAWRESWWTVSDAIIDTYRQWVDEDAEDLDLKQAVADLKRGWISFATSDDDRSANLRPLYATELKDEMFFVAGDYESEGWPQYHTFHKKWHSTYRKQLYERNYFDLYIFDLKGNLIYSVYKELDFATNFGTNKNLNPKLAEWQGSGLGDAFKGVCRTLM